MELSLAHQHLVVEAGAVAALQVANVKATILHDQGTVVPADQRALDLKVTVLVPANYEFGQIDGDRTRPFIGNLQCDFHFDHHRRVDNDETPFSM